MAHLTDAELVKLRAELDHHNNCLAAPISCPRCIDAKTTIMEAADYLLSDLAEAGESIRELVVKLKAAEIKLDLKDSEIEEAELGRDRACLKLEEAITGDVDTKALCNWAFDAGAELPDLRCSAGTYDVARVALLARGGPACSGYQPVGSSDTCKCGKPYREHRRELQGA